MSYSPTIWERTTVLVVAAAVVGLVGFLVIRNQPFADPNLVVAMRALLSLAIAVLGATIPGFLNVSWRGTGILIRAGGALALFVLTYLLTPTVLPSLADEVTRRHVEEEAKIAEDRAVTILTEMQADKDRVLDAIVERNARRAGIRLSSENRDLARVEAKRTNDFHAFSEHYDSAVARFQSLHHSYVEAIRNGERIRANAIRNQIHQEQLQYQLEVLIVTTDSGESLTNELSARIRDIRVRFAGGLYVSDPIPQDGVVQRILKKVRQSYDISVSDAAKLPEIETAVVGTVARASGSCLFLRSGTTSNDNSVMVLELQSMSGKQGVSRCIAWFEWGWQSHLKEKCQPGSIVTVTGTLVGTSNGLKVLQTSAIPERRPEPFRYRPVSSNGPESYVEELPL